MRADVGSDREGARAGDRPPAARVEVLPGDLANQIAAGEVVERPSSIVKELCENALDAEATRIDVAIETGGLGGIVVTDDGFGMSRRDAELAMLRHATSKLREAADLFRIVQFGFRGEALPSIASVSRLVLATRLRGEDEGTRIAIDGGGPPDAAPTGMAVGTRVEVRDLFFNVPARRKFLRAAPTESAHVGEVIEQLSLARPDVTFTLERDRRRAREYLRARDREERARDVIDEPTLARCDGERGPLRVEAYLGAPERARIGATYLRLFVNGRPIRDRALARSVAHAYGSVLEPGRYPIGVVYVDVPHELVDVNVHPQKHEVRFAEGRATYDAVYRILESALSRAFVREQPRPRPYMPIGAAPEISGPSEPAVFHGSGVVDLASDGVLALSSIAEVVADRSAAYAPASPSPEGAGADAAELASARFLGQVKKTFLICETPSALLVIDQHAAAERVTFDRLRQNLRSEGIKSQLLLLPIEVRVSELEAALVEEDADALATLGMDVGRVGATEVVVRSVPQLLARSSPEVLLRGLLAERARTGGRSFAGAIDKALATMACHGSIRAGDTVSEEEARAILAAVARVDFGVHCPHGRPVLMRVPFRELESRVGRR